MEMIVDNSIVNILIKDPIRLNQNLSENDQISLRWPSLLEYLGLGSLFSELPKFDENTPLFVASVATLCAHEDKEVVFYIYDHLFAEILSHIKALPQMDISSFLQRIQERQQHCPWLSSTLSAYEVAFRETPSKTLHDLIFYLGWDRMCVWVGQLFSYPSADPKYIAAMAVLKECLIESYLHIAHQGQTAPSFYRMLESLFFYEMREEHIHNHTEEEWTLLSQSFPLLKAPYELADFFYIDDAVLQQEEDAVCYLSGDSSEKIHKRIALAKYMIAKLKREAIGWDYDFQEKKTLTV